MDSPCSIQITGLTIIATILATLILLHLVFKRKHSTKRKNTMHYTEGTIDAIDVFDDSIRFSLLPSSGHLVSCDNGNKKVLFIDSNLHNAILIDDDKNVNGKEIIWFSTKTCLLHFLMSAKNNRNMIRVWCGDGELKKVETTPVSADKPMSADGIRVF